jgi:hypothetical protein
MSPSTKVLIGFLVVFIQEAAANQMITQRSHFYIIMHFGPHHLQIVSSKYFGPTSFGLFHF